MNQTHIDYLFSTTAPPTDRANLGRRSGSPFGFTDHLSSAAESRGQSDPRDARAKPSLSSPPINATSNDSSSHSRPGDSTSSAATSNPQEEESDRNESSSATDKRSRHTDTNSTGDSTAQSGSEPATPSSADKREDSADEQATTDDEPAPAEAAVIVAEFLTAQIDSSKTLHESAASKGADAAAAAIAEPSDGGDSESGAGKQTAHEVAVAADFQDNFAPAEDAIKTAAVADKPNPAAANQQAPAARKKSAASDKASEAAGGKAKRGASSNVSEGSDSEVVGDDEAERTLAAKDSTGDAKASHENDVAAGESRRRGTTPTVARNETLAVATPIAADAQADAQAAVAADANAAVANSESADAASADGIKPGAHKQDGLNSLLDQSHSASATRRSGGAAETEETPRVDPARFVGRVAKAFHTAAERGGTLQLRLAPPELGAVRIELTIADGIMSAQLETETSSAKRVLLEHLPALRDRLAEQNIRIERFDVDVRDDGHDGQAHERMARQQRQQQDSNQPHTRRPTTNRLRVAQPSVAAETVISARVSSTGINLVV